MELFISWSGDRSHRLAVVLKEWLKTHFEDRGISAFVSSDIAKGSLWLPEVNAKLQEADAGLVCLTTQSLNSDWVLFEAGALSTAVTLRKGEARIFTYLLDVDPKALPGPLSVYQSTVATMEDTLRLINSLLGYLDVRPVGVGEFKSAWDDLWSRLQQIGKEPVTDVFPGLADLFDRKTFNEPVEECTDQSWFKRYDGAVEVRKALQAKKKLVIAECDAQLADLYRDLAATVDGYAMDISALLFEPKTFDLANDGTRAIPCGVRAALERRRLDVHQLVAQIIDRRQQPLLPDAVQFARSPTFSTRKSIVHRIEQQLGEPNHGLPDHLARIMPQLLPSDWELDRIAAYIFRERRARDRTTHKKHDRQDARDAIDAGYRELDLVRATAKPPLMPLHYSLRWAKAAGQQTDPQLAADARDLATAIEDTIDKKGLDPGGQVRGLLSDLRAMAPPPDGKREKPQAPIGATPGRTPRRAPSRPQR
jgi:TIR domain